jgi:hypothetical protein
MKTMKKTLTIIMLLGAMCGYAQDFPPCAASSQTWTFGDLTWSDAIHVPECGEETFGYNYTAPQCRNYSDDRNTFYYYNWAYVDTNKTMLCPSPWRMPTEQDFNTLASDTTYSDLVDAWGYGGYAHDGFVTTVSTYAYYWSSTVYSSDTNHAYYLYYSSDGLGVDNYRAKRYGFRVRCVKEG